MATTARSKNINIWRKRALARGAQLEFQQPLPISQVVAEEPPVAVPYSRPFEQGFKQTLGRGPRVEFQSPITITAPVVNFQDGAGAVQGDSTVSGGLDAFADFAGSAIGDSTASGGLDAFADLAGSAIGDAVASGGLDALADFDGSAIGDATVDGAILATYDFPPTATYHLLTQQGARRKQRSIVEFSRPIPIAAQAPAVDGDGAGSAIGDAQADGALDALADFAGAASGDSTASGALDALADFAGTAIGDATASGALDALADLTGSAIGDATASGGLDALADLDGAATGDATCEAEGASENFQDCAGSAIGDSTCEGFIENATPAVVSTPDAGGTGGQVFRGAWTDRIKKRKKRHDDLDEMIAELRSRIEEVPVESTAEDIYQRTLRVSQALASQPDPSLRAIDNQIALLQEAINEIDDEEAILLLAA
jgi:hypothetical protein